MKETQADYQEKLNGILNDNQLQAYNELKEAAIIDMMKDLAESMRGFMKIAWENAGKHLCLRMKIKIAKNLKKIHSKAKQRTQQILTGEQYLKWEELKKQQQAR